MSLSVGSKTEYTVLGHEGDNTLLRFKLLTGRTHQIRVHMEHIGHPIIGDAMYGTRNKPLYTPMFARIRANFRAVW